MPSPHLGSIPEIVDVERGAGYSNQNRHRLDIGYLPVLFEKPRVEVSQGPLSVLGDEGGEGVSGQARHRPQNKAVA